MKKIIMPLLLFVITCLPAAVSAGPALPEFELDIRFDQAEHLLQGKAAIKLPEGRDFVVGVTGLNVLSASVDGRDLKPVIQKEGIPVRSVSGGSVLRIEYQAVFNSPDGVTSTDNPGVVSGNHIGLDRIALMQGWHPAIDSLAVYSLRATLPEGLEGIAAADDIKVVNKPGGHREFEFVFTHPSERPVFFAGRYVVEKEVHNGISIYSYFLEEDKKLGRTYIEHARKYLDLYSGMIAAYPFKRFSIVENLLPTGYAMPTFTLLGRDIVRLPFIVDTSLGHEMLHQWFGSSVYVNYSAGNWAEGLTTYLADHFYEEEKGSGSAYRRQMLINFQSAVTAANDVSLASFSGRSDRASAAIGYGKTGMVFHMLKRTIGEEKFRSGLKGFVSGNLFRQASWKNLQNSFEKASGEDLGWFFDQWLSVKGAPELSLSNVFVSYRGAKTLLSFDVIQKPTALRFNLPLLVKMRSGEVRREIMVDGARRQVEVELEGDPLELVVDEEYDLFRKLSLGEYPPVLARLINDANRIAVVPYNKEAWAAALSEALTKEGFSIKSEGEIKHEDFGGASVLFLDPESPLLLRFLGRVEMPDGDLSVRAINNPFGAPGIIAVLKGRSPEEAGKYVPRLMHYGKYSAVAFRGGRNILKNTVSAPAGMRERLTSPIAAVEVPRLLDLQSVIDRISSKKIIYIGEVHNRFEHHRAQFEIIRGLHRKNPKLAIGMEMFEKKYQKVLDDYISGVLDEKTFLKKSEYFSRWSFDYNLYREIMLYARENKLPVIALNAGRETVSKVAKEGLLKLSAEELKGLPEDMDLSDNDYRMRLREFFLGHRNNAEKNFDFFYQSQVVWDESMAHSLDDFIRKNPDTQVAVIAGSGHMAFGAGIPRRVFRLNGLDYAVVLNGEDPQVLISDYILHSEPVANVESPKLMVQFDADPAKLLVAGFAPGSVSEKAGLKKGDRVLSLDGLPMENLDDIKIHLFYKRKGEKVEVRVSRKRFLFGESELSVQVTL